MIDDELMGVAILTLNDDLTTKELEKIKGSVTGQVSDDMGTIHMNSDNGRGLGLIPE